MKLSLPLAMIATAFFSAVFIDASIDIATWIRCALEHRGGSSCIKETENFRTASYTGLAVGSMVAVLAVFYAVQGKSKSHLDAIILLLSVLASGLISILKIAVGDDKFPLFEYMYVALGFYFAIFALILLPLRIQGLAAFLTLGRVAASIILALIIGLVFFKLILPFLYTLTGIVISSGNYILQPYAVLALATPYAIVGASVLLIDNPSDVPKWHKTTVFIVVIVIAALYGLMPDLEDERKGDLILGMTISTLHLALPVMVVTELMLLTPIKKRTITTLAILPIIGIVAWQLIGALPYVGEKKIDPLLAAFEITVAIALSIICATIVTNCIKERKKSISLY